MHGWGFSASVSSHAAFIRCLEFKANRTLFDPVSLSIIFQWYFDVAFWNWRGWPGVMCLIRLGTVPWGFGLFRAFAWRAIVWRGKRRKGFWPRLWCRWETCSRSGWICLAWQDMSILLVVPRSVGGQVVTELPTFPKRPNLAKWSGQCWGPGGRRGRRSLNEGPPGWRQAGGLEGSAGREERPAELWWVRSSWLTS